MESRRSRGKQTETCKIVKNLTTVKGTDFLIFPRMRHNVAWAEPTKKAVCARINEQIFVKQIKPFWARSPGSAVYCAQVKAFEWA